MAPQHLTDPPVSSAHECARPTETAVAVVIPETVTGVDELPELAFPSWPEVPRPQHFTAPPATAHEWDSPAATAVADAIPGTLTGREESLVVPVPRCCPSSAYRRR